LAVDLPQKWPTIVVPMTAAVAEPKCARRPKTLIDRPQTRNRRVSQPCRPPFVFGTEISPTPLPSLHYRQSSMASSANPPFSHRGFNTNLGKLPERSTFGAPTTAQQQRLERERERLEKERLEREGPDSFNQLSDEQREEINEAVRRSPRPSLARKPTSYNRS
jgi:hypothetical protein